MHGLKHTVRTSTARGAAIARLGSAELLTPSFIGDLDKVLGPTRDIAVPDLRRVRRVVNEASGMGRQ